jgi:hypothetical protein
MPPIDYVFAGTCPAFEQTAPDPVLHMVGESRNCPKDDTTEHATHPLVAPTPSDDCDAMRAGWSIGSPHPKSHLAQSARWVASGIETTTARYCGEPTLTASVVSGMLGIFACPRSSHRNRLRPAPLVGAFGRWLKRHPEDADRLKVAASIYAQYAADVLCGTTVVAVSPMAILARWMSHASTDGLESKKKIYRATCEAIIAHMSGRAVLSIYEISQASCSNSSYDPIP